MATTYRYLAVNNKPPTPIDAGLHGDIMFDPDDSLPIYIGLNLTMGASITTNTEWKIYKFTYAGSNVTRIQLAYGAWANRVALF